jgi:hypothetical protein
LLKERIDSDVKHGLGFCLRRLEVEFAACEVLKPQSMTPNLATINNCPWPESNGAIELFPLTDDVDLPESELELRGDAPLAPRPTKDCWRIRAT